MESLPVVVDAEQQLKDIARSGNEPYTLEFLARSTAAASYVTLLMENPNLTDQGWKNLTSNEKTSVIVAKNPVTPSNILFGILVDDDVLLTARREALRNPNFTAELFELFWNHKKLTLTQKTRLCLESECPFFTDKHLNEYIKNVSVYDATVTMMKSWTLTEFALRTSYASVETAELVLRNANLSRTVRHRTAAILFIQKELYPEYPVEWVETLYL